MLIIGDHDRVNLMVQIANNSISLRNTYAEVHPKMTSDGRYPRGFERPVKVDEVLSFESMALLLLLLFLSFMFPL